MLRCAPSGPPSVVVGIDPGETTGVCVIELGSGRRLSQRISRGRSWLYEFPLDYSLGFMEAESKFADEMLGRLIALYRWPSLVGAPDVHIAIEDFVIREHTQDRNLLSPVRITAALISLLYSDPDYTWSISLQSAADAKTIVTDNVLRESGLYVAGMEHGRDAARQAMLYLRKRTI